MQTIRLSNLFNLSILDEADGLENSMRNAFDQHIKPLLDKPPSTQLSSLNHLMHSSSDNQKDANSSHNPSIELFHGLVYGYLASDVLSAQGNPIFENIWKLGEFQATIRLLQRIALEKYEKLQPFARDQFWNIVINVVTQDSSGEGASLVEILVRYMRVSSWTAEKVLNFLLKNMNWVLKQEGMIQSAVYVCLRLVTYHIRGVPTGAIDHPQQNAESKLRNLGKLEEQFCIQTIRSRFSVMVEIGRDFVRALHYASIHVKSLKEIYLQMLNDPHKLDKENNSFQGPAQILSSPTARRVLIAALTPDMERQIFFLMSKVKWGFQRRYQSWYAQMYFSAPGSHCCIIDLIRFTTVVYHPKIQKIQAGIVYRWGILGWLMTTISNDNDAENKRLRQEAHLACVFDWLCFNPKKDSFMNVEPSLLLIFHSIPKYVEITISVMETILSYCRRGDPEEDKKNRMETFLMNRDTVTVNVQGAMYKALQKKVIQSLSPIIMYEKMPSNLVEQIKKVFGNIEQQISKDMKRKGSPYKNNDNSPSGSSSHAHNSQNSPSSRGKPFPVKPSPPGESPFGNSEGASPFSKDSKSPDVVVHETGSMHKKELSQLSQNSSSSTLSTFQPHLNELSNHVASMYVNGRKNPITSKHALESLNRILDHYERETDEVITDENVQKLANFLIQLLSQEWEAFSKDERGFLNIIFTRAPETLWYTMISYMHRSIAKKQGANHNAKRSKNRFALLIRYMCMIHSGMGFRILTYCVRRHKCFLEETQDIILSSPSISMSDRHSRDILVNILPANSRKSTNTKKFLSLYEWSVQIRRNNDQPARDIFFEDMKNCASESGSLFVIFLPLLFKYFDQFMSDEKEGSLDLFEVVCTQLFPTQLYDVSNLVSTGRIKFLDDKPTTGVLSTYISRILSWDHFQQTTAFQLLTNELDRISTHDDFPEQQSTNGDNAVLPKEIIDDIIHNKSFDLKQNRDILAHIRHLFTCTYIAERYDVSEELTHYLLERVSPCDYGYFSSSFIYHWMYNQQIEVSSVYQVSQHISSLLEKYSKFSEAEQMKHLEKAENILLNLLNLRNTEIETRITKKHRELNDDSPDEEFPIILFSSDLVRQRLKAFQSVAKIKTSTHLQYLANTLIEDVDGVRLLTLVEEDVAEEDSGGEEVKMPQKSEKRKRSRKRKRADDSDEEFSGEDDGDVVPIAYRKKRRRKTNADYGVPSESDVDEEQGEDSDMEEEGEEEAGETSEERDSEDESEEAPKRKRKSRVRRRKQHDDPEEVTTDEDTKTQKSEKETTADSSEEGEEEENGGEEYIEEDSDEMEEEEASPEGKGRHKRRRVRRRRS